MSDIERLVVILAIALATWPLFDWLFPYTLRIQWDELRGLSWWIERK